MIVMNGRSEYPKLVRHIDYELAWIGCNPLVAAAFERYSGWHPTLQLAGIGQQQLLTWLKVGNEPKITILRPLQLHFMTLESGIAVGGGRPEYFEMGQPVSIKRGVFAGQEVYSATGQIFGQLFMYAILFRDRDRVKSEDELIGGKNYWSWEKLTQDFLDHLYGPNMMFW